MNVKIVLLDCQDGLHIKPIFEAVIARLPHKHDGLITNFYLGVDVAEDMVQAAGRRAGLDPHVRFIRGSTPDRGADYGVASGIFNVRLACPDAAWLAHVEATLESLDRTSRLGFAFNCLTAYSDADRKLDYLF